MESQAGSATGGQTTTEPVCEQGAVTVRLRELNTSDAEQARRWRNDERIWRWCRQNDFISDLNQRDWFNAQHADRTIKMYAIEVDSNEFKNVFVGVCGLTDICHVHSRAEFSLYVSPESQGKGIGRAALHALLKHGFMNLNLRQIWGEVFDGNPAMKTFLDIGFEETGHRPEFYFKDGKYLCAHLITLFRDSDKGRAICS